MKKDKVPSDQEHIANVTGKNRSIHKNNKREGESLPSPMEVFSCQSSHDDVARSLIQRVVDEVEVTSTQLVLHAVFEADATNTTAKL